MNSISVVTRREIDAFAYSTVLDAAAEQRGVFASSYDFVDIGNLYRLLRSLEDEGLVSSEWNAELPGPAKRTYELTAQGRRLLDRWAEALRRAQDTIRNFLDRYEEGR